MNAKLHSPEWARNISYTCINCRHTNTHTIFLNDSAYTMVHPRSAISSVLFFRLFEIWIDRCQQLSICLIISCIFDPFHKSICIEWRFFDLPTYRSYSFWFRQNVSDLYFYCIIESNFFFKDWESKPRNCSKENSFDFYGINKILYFSYTIDTIW